MSDPVKQVEIEDVLSSIRRLVSEDAKPRQPVRETPANDRLVLTPSLRVPDSDLFRPSARPDPATRPEPTTMPDPTGRRDRSGPVLLSNPAASGDREAPRASPEKAEPLLSRLVEQEVARAFEEERDKAGEHMPASAEAQLSDIADSFRFFSAEPRESAQAPDSAEDVSEDARPAAPCAEQAGPGQEDDGAERAAVGAGSKAETVLRGESRTLTDGAGDSPASEAETVLRELLETADRQDDDEAALAEPDRAATPEEQNTAADFAADSVLERKIAALGELVARQGTARGSAEAVDAETPAFLDHTRDRVLNWQGDAAADAAPDVQDTRPEAPVEAPDADQPDSRPREAAGDTPEPDMPDAERPDAEASVQQGTPDPFDVAVLESACADTAASSAASTERKAADPATPREEEPERLAEAKAQDAPPEKSDAPAEVAVDGATGQDVADLPPQEEPAFSDRQGELIAPPVQQDLPAAATIDEALLRDMVSDIVRQELQGVLGERITRNVRKLVRREIHRVLMSQDLD